MAAVASSSTLEAVPSPDCCTSAAAREAVIAVVTWRPDVTARSHPAVTTTCPDIADVSGHRVSSSLDLFIPPPLPVSAPLVLRI